MESSPGSSKIYEKLSSITRFVRDPRVLSSINKDNRWSNERRRTTNASFRIGEIELVTLSRTMVRSRSSDDVWLKRTSGSRSSSPQQFPQRKWSRISTREPKRLSQGYTYGRPGRDWTSALRNSSTTKAISLPSQQNSARPNETPSLGPGHYPLLRDST